jgi:hypothetical protein
MVADVLAIQQVRRLVYTWRPAVDERLLCLGIMFSLFITSFWQVTALRGHVEGLMLLFLLLTLRWLPRNLVLGGLCAGMALATKHMVAMELLPIGIVLLTGGWRVAHVDRQGRAPRGYPRGPLPDLEAFLIWGGIAAAVFLGWVLPAAVVNPGAVWYAFITLPGRLILTGPGLPVLIDKWAQGALGGPDYAQLHTALMDQSNLALPLIAGAVALVAVSWAARRGQPITLEDPRLLGLIALSSVTQVVFAKWVGPHYYQLPLLLAFIWDVVRTAPRIRAEGVRPGTFPWIGLGAAIAFRGISQFELPDFKFLLILLVYAGLWVLLLWGVLRRAAGDEAA